jgi:gamma-glutamyltranspeptidase
MVVAGHPLAARAGKEVLAEGGNAADAAVAAAAVLSVVCPYACSLGGDVFVLAYDARSGRIGGLNGSGVAPAKATLDSYGGKIPQTGPLSISVPGLVAGLQDLLERHGTRPLGDLLQPAIRIAQEGFPAHRQLIRNSEQRAELIVKDAETARLFLPGGKPFAVGDMVRQPELATVLTKIAAEGPEAFYNGPVARSLADAIQAAGGVMRTEDFARHKSLWQEAVAAPFVGHDIVTMPPNSYGLTLLFQLLALESDGIGAVDPDSAEFAVRGIVARRKAYAQADGLIGDPVVCEAPARAKLAELIAGRDAGSGVMPAEARDRCTACVVVLDGQGNAVSLIESVSAPFGAGITAPGTGILFNNRMPGFSTKPGHPNILAPGKRPAHTLAPCLVMRDGKPVMAVGTPGTVGQTCVLAQVLARILACGQAPADAVAAPRWSVALDGKPIVEAGMDGAVKDQVAAAVADLKAMPDGFLTFGSFKIAASLGEGFLGVADGRRMAEPMGL